MALAVITNEQIIDQLNTGTKWSGNTITYSFPTLKSGLYTNGGYGTSFKGLDATQQSAAELALQLWDDLITPDMQRTSAQTSWNSANIEFGFASGVGFAYGYYPTVGTVWFDSGRVTGDNSLVNPVVGTYGFSTYMHEIGHALGLDHMGDYDGSGATPKSYQDSTVYSIMSYFGPNRSKGSGQVAWADWVGANGKLYSPQTPMVSDILAIQKIYGVETTTRTGNTTYGFNSNITDATAQIYDFTKNLNPVLTLYDSGGIDTLDLSGWNSASVIDLNPGAYSSANYMTSNIAIAYSASIENAVGGGGVDRITGNALANRLAGGGGDDILRGGAGNDTVDGGEGADTAYLEGVWADMVYAYDAETGYLTITSKTGEVDAFKGVEVFIDSANVQRSFESLAITEEKPAIETPDADKAGVVDGAGDRTSPPVNLMQGSARNDTYVVDGVGDVVSEECEPGVDAGGIDLVKASVSHVLSNFVEKLTLTGSGDIDGAGNDLANTLTGNAGANVLQGFGGNDSIIGDAGNDTLLGDEGNDSLNGGAGADTMRGGAGNDTYSVDSADDVVSEEVEPGVDAGGVDLVRASVSHTLGRYVEKLTLTGVADIDGTGNDLANTLTGNAGANVLRGFGGNDTLFGDADDDTLLGDDGNDSLNGGVGADVMHGGSGNDTYNVDNAGDVVTEEIQPGVDAGGADLVKASISYTLGRYVEKLTLTGSANIDGAGNEQANTLVGNAGANVLRGLGGNDTLSGDAGNDTLFGDDGNDNLNGGTGMDALFGGAGNDTYNVDSAGDVVSEEIQSGMDAGGVDLVNASISYTLGSYVEKLTLTGSAAIDGSGNDLANTLTGNAGANALFGFGGNDVLSGGSGNDLLVGGAGADTLTGGAGADAFRFDALGSAADRDKIADFVHGVDRIEIDRSTFAAFGGDAAGALDGGSFTLGDAATSADHHLIYSQGTGSLYYDADGAGGAAHVLIAQFSTKPVLDAGDFFLI